MQNVQSYINAHKKRYLDELLDFLKIPSVSADPKHAKDVRATAEFVAKALTQAKWVLT
jgi:acetylornithine deacetylase/succinyl-diaminopimelate desuccinylase-like protein